jgi:hypothetical protein
MKAGILKFFGDSRKLLLRFLGDFAVFSVDYLPIA